MRVRTFVAMFAALAAAAVPAAAQSPRYSLSFDLGADRALTGDVHAGGTGTVLGLPTRVGARSFGDIYETPMKWGVTFGAHVGESTELRTRVFRTSADSIRTQVGDVASLPLFAEFARYRGTGVEFGVRQYYGLSVRPYAGASVGFVRVDAIPSTFSVPAAAVTLADVPMYEDSTLLTFALSGGVLVPIGARFGLQGGVDFRWMDNLSPVDGLAGTGLEPINDKTRRWSLPITFGAVVRF